MKRFLKIISHKDMNPSEDSTNNTHGPILGCGTPGTCLVDSPAGPYYVECDAPPPEDDGGGCC